LYESENQHGIKPLQCFGSNILTQYMNVTCCWTGI